MEVSIDGKSLKAATGATVLEACDAAGRYVPRLCYYPGLGCSGETAPCGLCVVRLGDGSVVLACATPLTPGMKITTDDTGLRSLRLERLAPLLAHHPHICLSCPDRDGCARTECSYGHPPEARCCDKSGRCELGMLVDYLDADQSAPRSAVTAVRASRTEGRIRLEPGLCVGCGRCVRVCMTDPQAGGVLHLVDQVALPRGSTLRASGCTFCGSCVMVCPTGALTAPGDAGAQWLTARRERSGLQPAVLPPERREPFTPEQIEGVPHEPGVFRLLDGAGAVFRIGGVPDLRHGLTEAFADLPSAEAEYFQVELDPLYTQRESELLSRYLQEWGQLPPGNDLSDDLFDDEED